MHVDDWLDTPFFYGDDKKLAYAKFVVELTRFPAWKEHAYREFIVNLKLYCTYKGKRFRVTGSSAMGDLWLHSNFKNEGGYEIRVDVEECSDWSEEP